MLVHKPESGILLSALCTSPPSSTCWILDSGASYHISSSLPNFSHIQPAFNHCAQLPNQTKIHVHFVGTVVLTRSITLCNLFYVLDFKLNLLSIGSLLQGSNCTITFTSNSFYIKDGKGEFVDGLYLFKNTPQPVNTLTIC